MMAGPSQTSDLGSAFTTDGATTLQALAAAARAYTSLNGGGAFPLGASATGGANPGNSVDASALLAVLAQGQATASTQTTHAQQIQALAALFGGGSPQNMSSQASQNAMNALAALLPSSSGGSAASATPTLNLNQVAAMLQNVGQHANQAPQHQHAPAPPPASYTPPPHTFLQPSSTQLTQPQRAVSEPTAVSAATSHNPFSQVVAAHHHAAAAATNSAISKNALLPNIQSWSLEKLENHVKILQQMNQPVPQSVALLLADARRKEEKRTAKRVANRKSACTSRARKKALVEEMTRTNARLRRQALILSLLPDLVIVISQEGEITFCSAQVERMLRHKIDDLIGSDIRDILIPDSRTALGKLMADLTAPEKSRAERRNRRARDAQRNSNAGVGESKAGEDDNGNVSAEASAGSGGVSSGAAAVVSDQSFPLSVVKVDSKQEPASDENENSDTSGGGGKEPVTSSLSNSTPRSPSASLANSGSGSEDGNRAGTAAAAARKEDGEAKNERLSPSAAKGQRHPSSDDSSSGSTETKNIRKANENLERNVRWHNKKLQRSLSKSAKSKSSHKDDVLGDSVTPNNALARLSSLQHYPENIQSSSKKRKSSQYDSIGDRSSSEDSLLAGIEEKKKNVNNENASDDSGYRESNDSREETSSSASESSNSNRRNKPLAPTCNVCLIRNDLTTLWCEVTSSTRTKSVEDEAPDEAEPPGGKIAGKPNASSQNTSIKSSKASTGTSGTSEDTVPAVENKPATKELLLCLRPIRDGEGKVDESLRFYRGIIRSDDGSSSAPSRSPVNEGTSGEVTVVAMAVSAVSNADADSSCENTIEHSGVGSSICVAAGSPRQGPPKKRTLPLQSHPKESSFPAKRQRTHGSSGEAEKSVVESLMLMSNKSN